jgi:hypothetical protein
MTNINVKWQIVDIILDLHNSLQKKIIFLVFSIFNKVFQAAHVHQELHADFGDMLNFLSFSSFLHTNANMLFHVSTF